MVMQSGSKEVVRGPTGRALIACQHCRGKKMKCNSERPRCRNCEANGKECVYVELNKQPRPSKARIARLEEELRDLQIALSELRVKGTSPPDGDLSPSNLEVINNLLGHKGSLLLRDIFSAEENPTYHGPTSAMFHDDPETDHGVSASTLAATTLKEHVQKELWLESAKQRRLEYVNLSAGKLDLDGVDPDLAMHLLSVFWERGHHWALIVYRTPFMRDMANSGPYFSKLLLNAIYFAASKFTSRRDVRYELTQPATVGWRFRRRIMELMPQAIDRSSIPTIQALLVVASSLFTWCDERSAAWLYAGIALRMVVDLGMHVESPADVRKHSGEQLEVRRRVFWAAFVLDKLQSLYQGRPVSLREADTRVPIEFLDEYEELEIWAPTANIAAVVNYDSTEPGYGMSWLGEFSKLSVIIDRVINLFYTEKTVDQQNGPYEDQMAIHGALKTWRATLPACFHLERLSNGILLPHVLSLICLYDTIVILLHRPFVSEGHRQFISPSVASESFSICASAAKDFTWYLAAYEREFSLTKAPFIMSYTAYVSATILVRIAAQGKADSEAHGLLRICLRVLEENQTIYWAANRANIIIRGLARRMGVNLKNTPCTGFGTVPTATQNSASVSNTILSPVPAGTANSFTEIGDFDIPMLDIDIHAIMRSFVADGEVDAQQSPYASRESLMPSDLSSTTRRCESGPSFADASSGIMAPTLATSDESFFDDPIFGFSSALYGFDTATECDLPHGSDAFGGVLNSVNDFDGGQ